MTLKTLLRQWWFQHDLTDKQLEENRVRRAMLREAYHHDKRLGRVCPRIYFHFRRSDYALLLRAARASHMNISEFLQQAALDHAHVVMEVTKPEVRNE